jgi:hypothetical protein
VQKNFPKVFDIGCFLAVYTVMTIQYNTILYNTILYIARYSGYVLLCSYREVSALSFSSPTSLHFFVNFLEQACSFINVIRANRDTQHLIIPSSNEVAGGI